MPAGHPLREIRQLVRAVLKDLGPSFGKLYADEGGRDPTGAIAERLAASGVLSIRSERQLMEQSSVSLVCWARPGRRRLDTTTFTKNRERLSAATCFRSS